MTDELIRAICVQAAATVVAARGVMGGGGGGSVISEAESIYRWVKSGGPRFETVVTVGSGGGGSGGGGGNPST